MYRTVAGFHPAPPADSEVPEPQEEDAARNAIRRLLGTEPAWVLKRWDRPTRRVFYALVDAQAVVLKVLRNPRPRSISCEFATRGFRAAGVPTPAILGALRGGDDDGFLGLPCVAEEMVEGVPLGQWLAEPDSPDDRTKALAEVGECMSRVHQIRTPGGWGKIDDGGIGEMPSCHAALTGRPVRRPNGEKIQVLDTDWLEWAGLISARSRRKLERLFRPASFPDSPLQPRLLHTDLNHGNILVSPDTGRLTGIIDLHNAAAGDPALDVARAQYFYREAAHFDAFMAGYGPVDAKFQLRQRKLLALVILGKMILTSGDEPTQIERNQRDNALLESLLDVLV